MSTCILIDDIGEGLDYERSTALIKLLINKCLKSKSQIVLTTNDKFIMNNTDLEYWNVIIRDKGIISLVNKKKDPILFEQFRFTGLNNFDFFSTGYYKGEFNEAETQ
jgi:hypothetical protein